MISNFSFRGHEFYFTNSGLGKRVCRQNGSLRRTFPRTERRRFSEPDAPSPCQRNAMSRRRPRTLQRPSAHKIPRVCAPKTKKPEELTDEIFGNSDSPPGGAADAVAVDAARPLPGESVEASD